MVGLGAAETAAVGVGVEVEGGGGLVVVVGGVKQAKTLKPSRRSNTSKNIPVLMRPPDR
jgi:hypothetical protein